jgi:enoyl-CoA hydratase/carnithine racemase
VRTQYRRIADWQPEAFELDVDESIAVVRLARPERKNPLTFAAYAELRDLFRAAAYDASVQVFVIEGAGGNFSSGGDVYEIIGPLTQMSMPELLDFTRMTGDLVKAMRSCPQPVIAAVDGVCAGAGAILAMASDFRIGTPAASVAFLFTRVGLAGCDMGACAILPRLIGQGRATELLFTGRAMDAVEALAWGFFNSVVDSGALVRESRALAATLRAGPTFAHGITKTMLHQEWNMSVDQAIEMEAQAQAICMQTDDFVRAFDAFSARRQPVFEGN